MPVVVEMKPTRSAKAKQSLKLETCNGKTEVEVFLEKFQSVHRHTDLENYEKDDYSYICAIIQAYVLVYSEIFVIVISFIDSILLFTNTLI